MHFLMKSAAVEMERTPTTRIGVSNLGRVFIVVRMVRVFHETGQPPKWGPDCRPNWGLVPDLPHILGGPGDRYIASMIHKIIVVNKICHLLKFFQSTTGIPDVTSVIRSGPSVTPARPRQVWRDGP